jgi:glycosyltransferase involved in cell wall biosynthesis
VSQPLVSVVIPVYNAEKHIRSTLDSVFAQTYTNLEIITVDDDSPDGSAEVIKSFGDRIKYIHQENRGPAAARNTGIRAAKGEYIAFIDADDQWMPEKTHLQIAFFSRCPKSTALVHTDNHDLLNDALTENPSKNLPEYMEQPESFDRLFQRNFIATSSVMCRTSALSEIGLFDESPGLFAVEDYDLWLRIASRYDLGFIATPLLQYRIHQGGISRNIDRSYTNERNILEKWKSGKLTLPQNATVSLRARYRKLYQDWGNDLNFANYHFGAAKAYITGAVMYGPKFYISRPSG